MQGTKGVLGVVIDSGPADWQIFQQSRGGEATIHVSGRWGSDVKTRGVDVRLVRESDGAAVTAALDWTPAKTASKGTWSAVLPRVPAGGLYRLETHLLAADNPATEWALRGDMRHFLGVGDLWIIAGQSNSAGYGRGPCDDPPALGVHVLNNALQWALATHPLNESTDTAHPANREGANSGHSPWLQCAKCLQAELGHPIGLIQTSLGGSGLGSWNPTEPNPSVLFDLMVDSVGRAGGKARGVLWYQGESDTGPGLAETYQKRFIAAVRAWRKALKCPDLHVLTVQLNRCVGGGEPGDRLWTMVRDAQRRIPHRLKGVTVVPTLDLTLGDMIHTSSNGNMLLGERAARAILGGEYGRTPHHLAPEPAAAKPTHSGKAVLISFDHVAERLDSTNPWRIPFRVADAAGDVEVVAIELPGNATIRLRLGRKLQGKAVVHGAYGADPPVVPCDMPRQMPILSFLDFPIDSSSP